MTHPIDIWRRLVPAYAAGYFLSYGLRSINAVIAPELMRDMGITATGLGLLTSTYFLAFGLFQLPLGLLLDRFGPRRVEAALLLVAAAGCALFGFGTTLMTLVVARALIGLGVSACLMASFKAFSQWSTIERLPSLTASIMIAGSLGALSASVPAEVALPLLGWRGIFHLFAALLILTAGFVMLMPDHPDSGHQETFMEQIHTLGRIFKDRVFWRFAPQGCLTSGGFMAIQGLWAVPWMMEVNGASRSHAAGVLFLMGSAMLIGYIFIATCAGWLFRRGVKPMALLSAGLGFALLVQLAIILNLAPPNLLWPLMGLSFSLSTLAYSQVSIAFPVSISGRVNTAFNLMMFAGAFGLQWGIGAAVEAFAATGMVRADAFRLSFALLLAAQGLAFGWFLLPANRTQESDGEF
jgi:predicted MFS family arabinose efflux permease